jgi:hypothetical protein
MKEKHLYILGCVFLALIIIFFITKPRTATINYDEIVQNLLFGFSKDNVAGIEIYKQTPAKEIRLELVKQDKQWTIPTYFNAKAKESNVSRIITDLLDMTGKVRTSDPKHLETFKISDDKGIHIILKDEAQKPLANLIIGKKGEDYNEGFVRFAGKDKIYAVDKNILSSLGIYGEADTLSKFNAKSFVDLNAVKLEKKDLRLAALVANGVELIIEKVEKSQPASVPGDTTKAKVKEYEWVLRKGQRTSPLDQKEVDNFFRDATSISAQELVDNIGNNLADFNKPVKYGTAQPSHYMVFMKDNDEKRYNVLFGKEYEKDKGYFMQVQYEGLVYQVIKSKYDTIFKWVTELPKKLPQPEKKKEELKPQPKK